MVAVDELPNVGASHHMIGAGLEFGKLAVDWKARKALIETERPLENRSQMF